jgi:hypothetical protein
MLFIAILIGVIPATIATLKGRNFFIWWIYGALLFIVALIHSLLMSAVTKCPFCAETIPLQATVCPNCHRDLPQESQPSEPHLETGM